jgi:hypothetical protein
VASVVEVLSGSGTLCTLFRWCWSVLRHPAELDVLHQVLR